MCIDLRRLRDRWQECLPGLCSRWYSFSCGRACSGCGEYCAACARGCCGKDFECGGCCGSCEEGLRAPDPEAFEKAGRSGAVVCSWVSGFCKAFSKSGPLLTLLLMLYVFYYFKVYEAFQTVNRAMDYAEFGGAYIINGTASLGSSWLP